MTKHYPMDRKKVAEKLRSFQDERWADSPYVGWLCCVFGLNTVASSKELCAAIADYVDPDCCLPSPGMLGGDGK